MIDSGSDAGLITSDAVRRLGLAVDPDALIRLHGTGGAGRNAAVSRVRDLTIGSLSLGNVLMPVGALPGAPILTPGVVGFLGGDVLSQFDLDIDVPGRTLTIYRISLPSLACATPPVWHGSFASAPLTAEGVRLFLIAELDGHPVRALVDTGARSVIVSTGAAHRAGVSSDMLAADSGGITSGVDMREKPYQWHRFASITIGGEIERSPVLTVTPLSESFDMLLGNDWIARHEVWISYATRMLFFRKGPIP